MDTNTDRSRTAKSAVDECTLRTIFQQLLQLSRSHKYRNTTEQREAQAFVCEVEPIALRYYQRIFQSESSECGTGRVQVQ
jgi:hypothetical protein